MVRGLYGLGRRGKKEGESKILRVACVNVNEIVDEVKREAVWRH